MKRTILLFLAGIVIVGMSITSCQKTNSFTNPAAQDTSTVAAQDNIQTSMASNDAENTSTSAISNKNSPAMQVSKLNKNLIQDDEHGHSANSNKPYKAKGKHGDSVTISIGNNGRDTMKCDFQAGVKSALDGNVRKGAIINHFSKSFTTIGFSDTITFDGYSINGFAVTGTIIITRINDSTFTRQIIGGELTHANSMKSSFSSSSTQIFDYLSSDTASNPALIIKEFGSYSGSTQSGISYTAVVAASNPIILNSTCSISGGIYPVGGSIDITSSAFKSDRIVDYGTGSCDASYTVKIGSYSVTKMFSSN